MQLHLCGLHYNLQQISILDLYFGIKDTTLLKKAFKLKI